jgi:hypothetical protein
MRAVRDCKAKIRPKSEIVGSDSPFNIATSFTLANFTQEEINTLYSQHTEATGQAFEQGAVERAWYWSEGQPWLVNALVREAIEKKLKNDWSKLVTVSIIDAAAEALMLRRDNHIDSLLALLSESRVRRFIEPMLAASEDFASLGAPEADNGVSLNNDLQYCLDLGLLKRVGKLRPSNPIYASIIVRYLNENIQLNLPEEIIGKWMDGQTIDMTGLLGAFQDFWRLKSEKYLKGLLYHEAGPHMLLTAFLQRVVNGGAIVTDEFADGQGYVDIDIKYAGCHYPIELKIKENHRMKASLDQIARYMDGCLAKEGWLVVFDRRPIKTSAFKKTHDQGKTTTWMKKKSWDTIILDDGLTVHVVGC